jgi:hypothetical protein
MMANHHQQPTRLQSRETKTNMRDKLNMQTQSNMDSIPNAGISSHVSAAASAITDQVYSVSNPIYPSDEPANKNNSTNHHQQPTRLQSRETKTNMRDKLNTQTQSNMDSIPNAGISSHVSAAASAITDQLYSVSNPIYPNDESILRCNRVRGYCPFQDHLPMFPKYYTGTRLPPSTRLQAGCGVNHKRVMLIWLSNEVYGDTRYSNTEKSLDRYYSQFGKGCVRYHSVLMRALTETNIGKELLITYEEESPGTMLEFRTKTKSTSFSLKEYALVKADPDDDGDGVAHYIYTGVPLSEREPAFNVASDVHSDSTTEQHNTNNTSSTSTNMDFDFENFETVDLNVMAQALMFREKIEEDLFYLYGGEWCHVPQLMAGLEMDLSSVPQSIQKHSNASGRKATLKSVNAAGKHHEDKCCSMIHNHACGKQALRVGADNYQSMDGAQKSVTSMGSGGFSSSGGGRFNALTSTDLDLSIGQFPPTTVNDTLITNKSVIHSMSTIEVEFDILLDGTKAREKRLKNVLKECIKRETMEATTATAAAPTTTTTTSTATIIGKFSLYCNIIYIYQ